jgi:glycerol-3-phosphate dehydrogenase
VLDIANRFFPHAGLTQRDVISSWAGLRPLIAHLNEAPSDISREHEIHSPEPRWWDVAGGKLTTYRLMAEQTVDRVVESLKSLKDSVGKIAPCRTAAEPLLSPAETKGISGILPPEPNRDVVRHFCANEWAIHLDDVMIRRTRWHYYFTDASERAQRVADWMGEFWNWSETARADELKRYREAVGDLSEASSEPAGPSHLLRR